MHGSAPTPHVSVEGFYSGLCGVKSFPKNRLGDMMETCGLTLLGHEWVMTCRSGSVERTADAAPEAADVVAAQPPVM
jgi:hypothetical protein